MIARRRMVEISAAVALSLTTHYAIAVATADGDPPILIEGGAPAEIAALGNSFADFAAGYQAPEPVSEAPIEPVEPVETEHVAEPLATVEPVETDQRDPIASPASEPVQDATPAAEAQTTPPAAANVLTGDGVEVSVSEPAPATTVSAAAADVIEPLADVPFVPTPVKRPERPKDQKNLAAAREALERAEAQRERQERARRERERAERQAAEARRTEQTRRREQQQAARGNAEQNARAGQADGRDEGRAPVAGARQSNRAAQAGNAAVSNYPGKVYARIRRTRQRPAEGRGTARIRFSITASGGLGAIRVASSSGSAAIDQVALDHIRRSAPFPRPPAGAQRSFVIPVRVQ